MIPDEVVIEYRGYLLIQRIYTGTGSEWIARPDGSWRYSEPTIVELSERIEWVVGKRSASGVVEELKSADSYDKARCWIDASLAELIGKANPIGIDRTSAPS